MVVVIALLAFVVYGSMDRKSAPYNNLKDVKKSKKIVVGTFAKIDPMTYKDEAGNNIGFDIDILKELTSRMGISFEIKEKYFPDLFKAIKAGEVDIAISAITITPERQKEVLFTDPYFNSGQVLIIRKDNKDIKGLYDLGDKKVGVPRGTTVETEAEKYVSPGYLKSYENFEEADALISGDIDAIIHDYTAGASFVKNYPELEIITEPFTKEPFGIVAHKENKELIEEMNKILEEMKEEGVIEKLEEKWFK